MSTTPGALLVALGCWLLLCALGAMFLGLWRRRPSAAHKGPSPPWKAHVAGVPFSLSGPWTAEPCVRVSVQRLQQAFREQMELLKQQGRAFQSVEPQLSFTNDLDLTRSGMLGSWQEFELEEFCSRGSAASKASCGSRDGTHTQNKPPTAMPGSAPTSSSRSGRCDPLPRIPETPATRHGGQEEWPAHRLVRGRLTLKATASHSNAIRAVCSIRNGILTLSMAEQPASTLGNLSDRSAVLAEVPVHKLAVGLLRGRTDMMIFATLHQSRMYDEIYCVADGQAKRNKWIAVFRRIGVPVFDVSEGAENAKELRL